MTASKFSHHRAAFAAIREALGLTDDERRLSVKLGPDGQGAKLKRDMLTAALAGVGKQLLLDAFLSAADVPDVALDWEATKKTTLMMEDKMAVQLADIILADDANGHDIDHYYFKRALVYFPYFAEARE